MAAWRRVVFLVLLGYLLVCAAMLAADAPVRALPLDSSFDSALVAAAFSR